MHRTSRKLALVVTLTALPALVIGGAALAALDKGTLPTAAFSYTSALTNSVDIAAAGMPVVSSPAPVATPASSASDATLGLQAKGSVTVKTTFTTAPTNAPYEFGWHYHNGPVFITVTTGTLTYYDDTCAPWDLSAGQSYIESPGQVLNAKVLSDKNASIVAVEWFSTRLYPEGASDPVLVNAPCEL